jgi:ribonuclease Z
LLTETLGDSVAYHTDFLLDEPGIERLVEALQGCRTVVCEAQYRHADLALAQKHFHATATLSATVAQRAQVEELILFHVSVRYQPSDWIEMLREARQIFPRTRYPDHWKLETGA